MEHKIIGLYAPYPGAGKSTIAQYLEKERDYKIFSFATPVKKMGQAFLEEAIGKSNANFHVYKEKELMIPELDVTARYLLQTIGTEWGRGLVDENIWTKIMQNKIDRSAFRNIVIDDMRFPNEYRMVKEVYNGVVIKVERAKAEDMSIEHASENSLEGFEFDAVVRNNGSFEDLHQKIEKVLQNV